MVMGNQLKRITLAIGVLITAGFILFLANQINGLYQLANGIGPLLGQIVLWSLIVLMTILFSLPVVLILKLPKALNPSDAVSDLPEYQRKFKKRLSNNKVLKKHEFKIEKDGDLKEAIAILDNEADEEIKRIASTVFLTTAISQNGKLDALTVLATQSKMVWKIAHIYYQRPNLKDLINLYVNVGTATFLASEIEDMDLTEQFQPVLRAMMKNTATKSIPIVGSTANLVMDSLLEGTTNAFLTLRVGIIAKRYCGSYDGYNKGLVRKRAYVEASEMLGKIVLKSSGRVISSIATATKKASVDTLKSGFESIKTAGSKVGEGIANTARKMVRGKKYELPQKDGEI